MQEASQSRLSNDLDFWHGVNPKNGIAVFTTNGLEVELGQVDEASLWSIVPLKIGGKTPLHILAVWTRAEAGYIQGLDKSLTIYRGFLSAAPSIVLGDFNSNAIWDKPRSQTDFSRVASRMGTEFGLKSAYHTFSRERFGSETTATHYFRWHEDGPFHIDYCFVPSPWKVNNVDVGSYADWGSMSDHCPLVVDVSFSEKG